MRALQLDLFVRRGVPRLAAGGHRDPVPGQESSTTSHTTRRRRLDVCGNPACGRSFHPRNGSRYCSPLCKRDGEAARRRHREREARAALRPAVKYCAECGQRFAPHATQQTLCDSEDCRRARKNREMRRYRGSVTAGVTGTATDAPASDAHPTTLCPACALAGVRQRLWYGSDAVTGVGVEGCDRCGYRGRTKPVRAELASPLRRTRAAQETP